MPRMVFHFVIYRLPREQKSGTFIRYINLRLTFSQLRSPIVSLY